MHRAPRSVESSTVSETVHQVAAEPGADIQVVSTSERSPPAAILLGSVSESEMIAAKYVEVRHIDTWRKCPFIV